MLDWFRDDKPVKEKGYVTTLLGDEAVRVIGQSDRKTPFFLYLAFNAPHSPYQVPEESLAQYAGIADPARRAYAAMITAMDTEIGRVISRARTAEAARRTRIVVFHSDNGGPHSAKFAGEVDMSKSTIPPDNGPVPRGQGRRCTRAARGWSPSSAGQAASRRELSWTSRSTSWTCSRRWPAWPALARQAQAARRPGRLGHHQSGQAFAANGGRLRHRAVPGRAAQGDWKLIWYATLPSRVELYDIARDPSEKTNLAEQNPEVVAELKQRIEVLSRDAVPPLILAEALPVLKSQLFGSVVLPEEARAVEGQP